MGTSGAWGGTGGRAWGAVGREVDQLLEDPTPERAEGVLPLLADAMDWLDLAEEGELPESDVTDSGAELRPLPVGHAWTGSSGTRDRSSGSSGGGRSSALSQRRSTGGGGRSARRAASVGGRVLSAGLAYRHGDADTLSELGLDLGVLNSMPVMRRMNTILNRLVGAEGDIEATELRTVNTRVLRELLVNEITGSDAVRVYVVEYTMQVYASEVGESERDGRHSGRDAVEAERQVRSALEARARQIDLPESAVATDRLRDAIQSALGLMRRLMRGR